MAVNRTIIQMAMRTLCADPTAIYPGEVVAVTQLFPGISVVGGHYIIWYQYEGRL